MDWIRYFDIVSKARPQYPSRYRFLIIDGCEIHIQIAFIKDGKIKDYYLPPYSIHLLQPLNVGLFNPLQKYYGKQVDRLACDGAMNINTGNFLPLLACAHTEIY